MSFADVPRQVHIFQAFPFLEAAQRALISASLSRSLGGEEHDIDNENVRVVGGDGVVTGSGTEDLKGKLQDEGDTDPQKVENGAEVASQYTSWGRKRGNSILKSLSPIIPQAEPSGTKTPHEEIEQGTSKSNLRRI